MHTTNKNKKQKTHEYTIAERVSNNLTLFKIIYTNL